MGNLIDEDGTIIPLNKVDEALNNVGISLRDLATNQIRPLDDVLDDLGGKWEGLDKNTKAYLATVLAGVRQQNRFVALMENYDRSIDLANESINAQGTAMSQYSVYLDSMEAKMNTLKATVDRFWMTLVNTSTLKNFVDGITLAVMTLDNLVNRTDILINSIPILIPLLGVKLFNALKIVAVGLKEATGWALAFSSINLVLVGALALVAGGAILKANAMARADKMKQDLLNTTDNYIVKSEEEKKALENLQERYNASGGDLDKLKKIKEDLLLINPELINQIGDEKDGYKGLSEVIKQVNIDHTKMSEDYKANKLAEAQVVLDNIEAEKKALQGKIDENRIEIKRMEDTGETEKKYLDNIQKLKAETAGLQEQESVLNDEKERAEEIVNSLTNGFITNTEAILDNSEKIYDNSGALVENSKNISTINDKSGESIKLYEIKNGRIKLNESAIKKLNATEIKAFQESLNRQKISLEEERKVTEHKLKMIMEVIKARKAEAGLSIVQKMPILPETNEWGQTNPFAVVQNKLNKQQEEDAKKASEEIERMNESISSIGEAIAGVNTSVGDTTEMVTKETKKKTKSVDALKVAYDQLNNAMKKIDSQMAKVKKGSQEEINLIQQKVKLIDQQIKLTKEQARIAPTTVANKGQAYSSVTSGTNGGYLTPFSGDYRVTSQYGQRGKEFHGGTDFAMPIGTPLYATKSGTVKKAGIANGGNKVVLLQHNDGSESKYFHLDSWEVKTGQKVEQGQVIGKSGNTGRSTGAHLHFEIKENGKSINPLSAIKGNIPINNNQGDETTKITAEELESKLIDLESQKYQAQVEAEKVKQSDLFQNRLDEIDLFTNVSETKMSLMDKESEAYENELKRKIELRKMEQDKYTEFSTYLKWLTSAGILEGEFLAENQKKIHELGISWNEAEKAIADYRLELADLKIENIGNNLDKNISPINTYIEDLNYQLEMLEENDDGNEYQLTQKLIKSKSDLLEQYKKSIEYLQGQKKSFEGNEEATKKFNEAIQENIDKTRSLNIEIKDLNKQMKDKLLNTLEEVSKAYSDTYKKRLEEETEAHEKTMKNLDDELSKYEEIIDAKIKALTDKEDEDSYNKELAKLQKDRQEILNQINEKVLDNSIESKAIQQELAEQLAEKNKEIEEKKHGRSIELQKKALEKLKDNKKNEIKTEKETAETKFKKVKEGYEKQIDDEKRFYDLKTQIMNGHFDGVETSFAEMLKFLTDNKEKLGATYDPLIAKIKEAMGLMGQIPNGNTFTDKDGNYYVRNSDGSVTKKRPDGTSVTIKKDDPNMKWIPEEVGGGYVNPDKPVNQIPNSSGLKKAQELAKADSGGQWVYLDDNNYGSMYEYDNGIVKFSNKAGGSDIIIEASEWKKFVKKDGVYINPNFNSSGNKPETNTPNNNNNNTPSTQPEKTWRGDWIKDSYLTDKQKADKAYAIQQFGSLGDILNGENGLLAKISKPNANVDGILSYAKSIGISLNKYHTGGIVGGKSFNPQTEEIAKLLKGELVLNKPQLMNIPNIFRGMVDNAKNTASNNVFNISMKIDKLTGDENGAKTVLKEVVSNLRRKGVNLT